MDLNHSDFDETRNYLPNRILLIDSGAQSRTSMNVNERLGQALARLPVSREKLFHYCITVSIDTKFLA